MHAHANMGIGKGLLKAQWGQNSLEYLVLLCRRRRIINWDFYETDREVAEKKMEDHLGWLLRQKKSWMKLDV